MADRHAWAEETTEEVAAGVYRIPLPLPDDALRAVNVYVVDDGAGLSLIDGGWALLPASEQLERSLRRIGFGLADIRQFFVTHVHRDHYTQAIAIRQLHGSRVALGEHEKPNLDEVMASLERGHWRYPALARPNRRSQMSMSLPMVTVRRVGRRKRAAGLAALWDITTKNRFRHSRIPGRRVGVMLPRETKYETGPTSASSGGSTFIAAAARTARGMSAASEKPARTARYWMPSSA